MKVSFEGIGDQIVSFVKGSGAEKGVFVKLGASSTVAAADDGDCFAGLCVHADGGFADVQLKGSVTCAYTGTAPEVGFVKLVSAGGCSVKKDNGGREYLVLKVDTAASTLSFIM